MFCNTLKMLRKFDFFSTPYRLASHDNMPSGLGHFQLRGEYAYLYLSAIIL